MTALDAWFGTYDNPPRLDADTTGHARIVHRTTTGLRQPQPPGTATVTVQPDIQPLIDQIDREVAAKFDRERVAWWYRPDRFARGGKVDVPIVCGSSGLEDTKRTHTPQVPPADNTRPFPPAVTCDAPASVVDFPGEGALDHYARGGVIRVPLGRR